MEQRFRRQALYELIWSEPISVLAPQMGISDVALAKACKRHGIPRPGRGHWAKLKAGKRSLRTPLPPRALGCAETIHIGHSNWEEQQEQDRALMAEEAPPVPEFTESLSDLITRVTKLVGRVPRSRDLKSPHPAIAAVLVHDVERLKLWQQSRRPSHHDQPFFMSPYEQRRLKLVDALFKTFARLGTVPATFREKNPDQFTVRIGDSSIGFTVGKPGEKRSNWWATSDARRPATDPMHVKIVWRSKVPEGLILEWQDGPEAALETKLGEIMTYMIVAAEMQVRIGEVEWHEHRVARKAWMIEAERERQEEAIRQQRELGRRRNEAALEKLFQEAMSLRLAEDIRSYVAAVRTRSDESENPVPEHRLTQWSDWALEQADRIDPVVDSAFLQPVPEPADDKPPQHRPADWSTSGISTPSEAWHPNRWYTRLRR